MLYQSRDGKGKNGTRDTVNGETPRRPRIQGYGEQQTGPKLPYHHT